jgi:hypothetical protein
MDCGGCHVEIGLVNLAHMFGLLVGISHDTCVA